MSAGHRQNPPSLLSPAEGVEGESGHYSRGCMTVPGSVVLHRAVPQAAGSSGGGSNPGTKMGVARRGCRTRLVMGEHKGLRRQTQGQALWQGTFRALCQAAGDNPSSSHRVGKGEARDTVGPLLRGSQPWEHSAPRARQMATGPAPVCERNCILWGSGVVAVRAATCVARPGRGSCSCPVTVLGLVASQLLRHRALPV